MMQNKKIIAVDFDGVIAQYDQYKGDNIFGKPIPGAKAALTQLIANGNFVIVHTARGNTEAIKQYLHKYKIPFSAINEMPDYIKKMSGFSDKKIYADVYVDDRAICFNGKWDDDFVKKIEQFQPVYKIHRKFPNVKKMNLYCEILGLIDYAEKSKHFAEYLTEFISAAKIKIDAEKRYGTKNWMALGIKGVFVDVHRKFVRLKRFFWEDKTETTSENILDTCYDLINYVLHIIMIYKNKRKSK